MNGVKFADAHPVSQCDVLVCGGGPAGIAAAVTAARKGKRTVLVEQYGFLGGAAVAGLSGTICGMYYSSCKVKQPKQLVFGFADEFVQRLKAAKGITEPQKYGNTFVLTHDAFQFKRLADELMEENHIEVLLHTRIIDVECQDGRINGVWVCHKSGSELIRAKVVIDATGDADIAYRAGLETYKGDHGKIQNPTMIFKVANVNEALFQAYMKGDSIAPPELSEQICKSHQSGEYFLPRKNIWLFSTVNSGEVLCNCTRVIGADQRDLDVTDPHQHTEAEVYGRSQVEQYFEFFKHYFPPFKDAYISTTGCEVGVRQTRSIRGIKQLQNADIAERSKPKDGIAKCAWPIELHSGDKPKLDWILDDYYSVPFGTLVPEEGKGIIVAGRNLCAEHEALASARVVAQCFSYGQAAGVAASLSIDQNCEVRTIEAGNLINVLNADGAEL